jgi:putative ABC transport system permease protein
MVVLPKAGQTPEALASSIKKSVKGLEVVPPQEMRREVERSLRLWQALTVGMGLIAAATGALCIIITMTVTVYERTYEIGLKKAIGASNAQIIGEFLKEAALLAIIGWLMGLLSALAFVWVWNCGYRQEGLFLFDITPRVTIASLIAAIFLGTLAGSLPAISAGLKDPVQALRRRL